MGGAEYPRGPGRDDEAAEGAGSVGLLAEGAHRIMVPRPPSPNRAPLPLSPGRSKLDPPPLTCLLGLIVTLKLAARRHSTKTVVPLYLSLS
jgi:hypothetical protein